MLNRSICNLLIGLASALTAIPAFADSCPDESGRLQYNVAPLALAPPSVAAINGSGLAVFPDALTNASKAEIDLAYKHQQILQGVKSKDLKTLKSGEYSARMMLTTGLVSGAQSEAEVAIDGLTTLIESRAKQELEDWMTDRILDDICGVPSATNTGNDLFPQTCRLANRRLDSHYDVGDAATSLVTALRSDMNGLPGCLIYRPKHDPTGYLLASVYSQNAAGTSLEELLNGLAQSRALNKSPAAGDAGALGSADTCSFTAPGTFKGARCAVVIPIIAYAAAIRVKPYLDKAAGSQGADTNDPKNTDTPLADKAAAVRAFTYAFGQLADVNKVTGLKDQLQGWYKGLPDEWALDRSLQALNSINTLRQTEKTLLSDLKTKVAASKDASANQEAIASATMAIARDVTTQMVVAERLAFDDSGDTFKDMDEKMRILDLLQRAYAAAEAREYTQAMAALQPLLDCAQNPKDTTNTGYCPFIDGKKVDTTTGTAVVKLESALAGASSLADAKTSAEFDKKLDALALPVGSWRRRDKSSVIAITALPGIRVGYDQYNVPGQPAINATQFGVTSPVGLYSTATCNCWTGGYYGFMFSLLDLGNLMRQPSDISFRGGRITGKVDASVGSIFTPGIGIAYSLDSAITKSPLVFGLMVTRGPSSYRQANFDNSTTTVMASRGVSWSLFLSVDIDLFPFN